MNENVKIDYDTADKVMDLDGCGSRHTAAPGHARRPRRSKVYVKTIGDKTRADGVQGGCADSSTPPAAGR